MSNPMDMGLTGQRVMMGGNGDTVTNSQPMVPFVPQMQQPGMYYPNQMQQTPYPNHIPTPGQQQQNSNTTTGDNSSQSNLDNFNQKWFNSSMDSGNGQSNQQQQHTQQQQQQTPEKFDLMQIGPNGVQEFANGLDFTQGVPDQILQMFLPDDNGQQPRLMEGIMHLMNHVGRGVYSQAVSGASRLAGRGIQEFGQTFRGEIPNVMRSQAAADAMRKLQLPEMLAPSANAVVDRYLKSNPDASAESIQELLSDFAQSMGITSRTESNQRNSQPLGGLFD